MKTIISGNRRLSNIHCYWSVHYDFYWCSILMVNLTQIQICVSASSCVSSLLTANLCNCPCDKQIPMKQRLLTSSLQDKSLRNSEQRFLCRFTTQIGVSTPLSSTLLVNVDHSDIMSILTRQQNRC